MLLGLFRGLCGPLYKVSPVDTFFQFFTLRIAFFSAREFRSQVAHFYETEERLFVTPNTAVFGIHETPEIRFN